MWYMMLQMIIIQILQMKLNYIKQDKVIRNNQVGKNYKVSEFFQSEKRIPNQPSLISYPPYSHISYPQMTVSMNNIVTANKKIISKASQILPETNQNQKKSLIQKSQGDHQIENSLGYFDDFDKVLNNGEQQNKKQQIDLNDSFEKMQQKTQSQEQRKKKQKVSQNKKRREKIKKLKQRLDQVLCERQQLLETNTKLKQQIELMSRNSNQNTPSNLQALNQAKYQLEYLRKQYERLLEEKNKGNNLKRNTKYKSENTIMI